MCQPYTRGVYAVLKGFGIENNTLHRWELIQKIFQYGEEDKDLDLDVAFKVERELRDSGCIEIHPDGKLSMTKEGVRTRADAEKLVDAT